MHASKLIAGYKSFDQPVLSRCHSRHNAHSGVVVTGTLTAFYAGGTEFKSRSHHKRYSFARVA